MIFTTTTKDDWRVGINWKIPICQVPDGSFRIKEACFIPSQHILKPSDGGCILRILCNETFMADLTIQRSFESLKAEDFLIDFNVTPLVKGDILTLEKECIGTFGIALPICLVQVELV